MWANITIVIKLTSYMGFRLQYLHLTHTYIWTILTSDSYLHLSHTYIWPILTSEQYLHSSLAHAIKANISAIHISAADITQSITYRSNVTTDIKLEVFCWLTIAIIYIWKRPILKVKFDCEKFENWVMLHFVACQQMRCPILSIVIFR